MVFFPLHNVTMITRLLWRSVSHRQAIKGLDVVSVIQGGVHCLREGGEAVKYNLYVKCTFNFD